MPAAPVKKTDFPFSTRSITCRCSSQSPSEDQENRGLARRRKMPGESGWGERGVPRNRLTEEKNGGQAHHPPLAVTNLTSHSLDTSGNRILTYDAGEYPHATPQTPGERLRPA